MSKETNSNSVNGGGQMKIFIVFLLISILLASTLGVLIFRYFNRQPLFGIGGTNQQNEPLATVETGEDENANKDSTINETAPSFPTPSEEPDFTGFGGSGYKLGEAPKTTPTPKPTPSITPTPKDNKIVSNTNVKTDSKQLSNTNKKPWIANDYKPGDIKGDTHLVIWGDTLWEISEGKYGIPTKWRKIADANKVDYLWNGNPLITEGTNLALPKE